jgi:hypothetical protein
MTVSGTDDEGAFTDSGVSVLPTQRPSTTVDIHTLVPALSAGEKDTGTKTAVVLPAPQRSATQRR